MAYTLGLMAGEVVPAFHAHEEEQGVKEEDYIKVESVDQKRFLQTSVVSYQKGAVKVDLIGAVHIADQSYYQKLNELFDTYEVLLFEMIGGETLKQWAKMPKKEREANVSGLAKVYEGMAKMLDLSLQHHEIDYFKPHFVHADLTHLAFRKMQEDRNESIIGYAVKTQRESERQKQKQPNSFRLMVAMLAKRPNSIKRELMVSLAAGDDNMGNLSGESVIIDDRNAKCLEVLEDQVLKGKKHLGIFYGAAHLPSMHDSMLELGYQKVGEQWLNAWEVDL